jgi:lysozyme
MQASQTIIDMIKVFEGLRITPYDDGAGYMTIGYGHRIKPGEAFTVIDKAAANRLLQQDVSNAAQVVSSLVSVPLTQNQFDAMVSFTFNLGGKNLSESTLLELINQGDYTCAANEFPKWIHAGGKVKSGLVNRRAKEQKLFLT